MIPLEFDAHVTQHREGYWLFYPMGNVLSARRLPDAAAAEAMMARLSINARPNWIGLSSALAFLLAGYLTLACFAALSGWLWSLFVPVYLSRSLPPHTPDVGERLANALEWVGVGAILALLCAGAILAYLR